MVIALIGLNTAIFLLIANFLLGQRKQIATLQDQLAELKKNCDAIDQAHPMLVNADLLFSRQIQEINRQLISMDNQLQSLENIRDNDGGYQHAVSILAMGGSREDIVNSCHLSAAETDLLMNLQAYRSAIKA